MDYSSWTMHLSEKKGADTTGTHRVSNSCKLRFVRYGMKGNLNLVTRACLQDLNESGGSKLSQFYKV